MYHIFPTAYLPSIQYMSLFLKADAPAVEIFETYQKQSCRTRCRVLTANGIQTLTIPVVKVNGNHTMTKDIVISYKEPWQQIHLRCLESAYRKSAYFDYYFHHFEKFYLCFPQIDSVFNGVDKLSVIMSLTCRKLCAASSTTSHI